MRAVLRFAICVLFSLPFLQTYILHLDAIIHPKSWGSWGSNPANFFGFSAKFLAENPKPFMFSLCFETALPIFSKSCLNIAYILDKYTQISYFVSKYAILSQIHYIFMINALLSQNLVVEIYALFPPIFLG